MVILGVPKIIDYIKQHETPEKVCQQLGVCSTKFNSNKQCDACQTFITTIKEWLTSGTTEEMIIKKLDDHICRLISFHQGNCEKVIAQTVPVIIETLKQGKTPK